MKSTPQCEKSHRPVRQILPRPPRHLRSQSPTSSRTKGNIIDSDPSKYLNAVTTAYSRGKQSRDAELSRTGRNHPSSQLLPSQRGKGPRTWFRLPSAASKVYLSRPDSFGKLGSWSPTLRADPKDAEQCEDNCHAACHREVERTTLVIGCEDYRALCSI